MCKNRNSKIVNRKLKLIVQIKLFGITKDIIGSSTLDVELAKDTCVGQLKMLLIDTYPALADLKSLMIAVNSEYSNDDLLLNSSDEVALIPPVSGG